MSKQSWFTSLAVATLLLGCSNDNEEMSLDNQIGDSDVEIVLSSSNTLNTTRSSINSDESNLFEANGIGIFCAAKAKQGINSPAPDIDWTRYNEYGKTDIQMFNVKSNAVKITEENPINVTDTCKTVIRWAETDKHYYYPISNWYKYDFYGYYPIQTSENITVSKNYVAVNMEIDGSQDVIWGKANSDEEYAYSAKYYRTGKHCSPVINFKHVLTRFTFSVEAGADYTGSKANATRMKIKNVALLNMAYMLTLIVAGTDSGTYGESKVLAFDNLTKDFILQGENNMPFQPIQVSETERLKVGESLMAIEGLNSYAIRITIEDEKGNEYLSEFPLSIENFSDGSFAKAGHSYNINMTVYGPQEIGVCATLEPWIIESQDVDIEL